MSAQTLPDSIIELVETLNLSGLGMESEEVTQRLLATRRDTPVPDRIVETETQDGSDEELLEGGGREASEARGRGRGAQHRATKFEAAIDGEMEAGRFRPSDVGIEARFCFRAVGLGAMTREEARQLIAVSPKTERALRAFAHSNPRDAGLIVEVLEFRRCVMSEFERLLCSALPIADRAPEGGFCGVAEHSTVEPGPQPD